MTSITQNFLQTDWPLLFQMALPVLVALSAALLFVLMAPFLKEKTSLGYLVMGLLVTAAIFVLSWKRWVQGTNIRIDLLVFDRFAYSFDMIFSISTFLTLLMSYNYLLQEKIRIGEYYALIFFAVVGMMTIVHAGDLMVLFLGIEIMSLAAYILAGIKRESLHSLEASLKYFVLGSFASGFLLFGIAMAFGATGSTSFVDLQAVTVPPAEPLLILLASALFLIGFGFKIAAVPFHFWSPDVYEGSPTSVTAFMAAAIKAAGFAALIRILLLWSHLPQIPWSQIIWGLAALTMTLGNLVALSQTNIKRLLAYSSIAHAGYALVGVAAFLQKGTPTEGALASILFYLLTYSLTTLGAFAIIIALGRRGDQVDQLSDLSGLSQKHPWLAAGFTLFMLSLTGIPPTVGFIGKFYLFSSAMESGLYGLVLLGVINSAISAYYYLSPIIKMYFSPEKGDALPPLSISLMIAIFACSFLVIYLGVFPSEIYVMAKESVRELVF